MNCQAWIKYAELERSLSETDRARALFELAIRQPSLDMPELLWKVLEFMFLANFRFVKHALHINSMDVMILFIFDLMTGIY